MKSKKLQPGSMLHYKISEDNLSRPVALWSRSLTIFFLQFRRSLGIGFKNKRSQKETFF